MLVTIDKEVSATTGDAYHSSRRSEPGGRERERERERKKERERERERIVFGEEDRN
jgi:hypothetical protein